MCVFIVYTQIYATFIYMKTHVYKYLIYLLPVKDMLCIFNLS